MKTNEMQFDTLGFEILEMKDRMNRKLESEMMLEELKE